MGKNEEQLLGDKAMRTCGGKCNGLFSKTVGNRLGIKNKKTGNWFLRFFVSSSYTPPFTVSPHLFLSRTVVRGWVEETEPEERTPIPSSSTIPNPNPNPNPDPEFDLDLERRFQAFKTKSKPQQPLDINARFDALKTKSNPAGATVSASETEFGYESEEEEDEEAQIRKLIEWAKDAALLHPSPPLPPVSDAEDDDDDPPSPPVSDEDHRRKPVKKNNLFFSFQLYHFLL